MWGNLAVDGGLSILKTATSYMAAKQEASAKRKWQNYKNSILRISGAMNQNAINQNQNMAVDRSEAQAFEIERDEYTTMAAAEASAAAADTEGRSVNQTIYQIQRSGMMAQSNRLNDLENQIAGFDQQRLNTEMQVVTQTDFSPINSPDIGASLLGLGADLFSKYNSYQNPKK